MFGKKGSLTMTYRVMWTDCDHANINEEEAVLKAAGITDYKIEQCLTEDDVIAKCKGAVVLLNQYTPLREKVFSNMPELKCIVRYGVGVDNVDLEAATKYGVQVCNVPDYGTFEVADQAFSLLIACVRKTIDSNKQVHEGGWDFSKMTPIHRMSTLTVGVYGLGRIGKAFAKRVHAFGCHVVGYDILPNALNNDPEYDFIEVVDKEELFKRSDIVSLHCGLNAENAHFMNKEYFDKMKDGAIFVNVSRGGLVNENDLAEALISGKLSGAGIDVTCKEPLQADSKLRQAPNLIITPHIAWYSVESASDLKTKTAEEGARAILGQPPRCPVNKLN